MSGASRIEWTQVTWNPVTGCDRISPGCDHCYALTLAARLKAMGQANYQTDGQPPTSGPGFGVATPPGHPWGAASVASVAAGRQLHERPFCRGRDRDAAFRSAVFPGQTR